MKKRYSITLSRSVADCFLFAPYPYYPIIFFLVLFVPSWFKKCNLSSRISVLEKKIGFTNERR